MSAAGSAMWTEDDKGPVPDGGVRLPFKCVWLDGVMSSDYELDTLPLLFAGPADFEMYYAALQNKHPTKQKDLTKIKRFNLAARRQREDNDITGCLQVLSKCLHLRRTAFSDVDYQFYAALMHYLLSILYFAASQLATGELNQACALFALAKKEIGERGPSLTRSDRNLLSCILNNNWANYWLRRGKANAASQCCCRAYQLWMRVSDLSVHLLAFLAPFLVSRFATSLVLAKKYDEALKVYSRVFKTYAEDEQDRSTGPTSNATGPISVNITTLSLADPENPAAPIKCCLRSLSISLTPMAPEGSPNAIYATNWSLHKSAKFATFFGAAYARVALRKYKIGQEMLEKTAHLFNTYAEQSGVAGNPLWWSHLQKGYEYVCLKTETKNADHFRLKFDEIHEREMMYYSRVVNREVERDRAAKRATGDTTNGDASANTSIAAAVLADPDETDPDLKLEAQTWEGFLPVLRQMHAHRNPKAALRELRQQRAASALDYQSIRNLAGNLVKGQTTKRLRKHWDEMDNVRKMCTQTPPPPATTSHKLLDSAPLDDSAADGPTRFVLKKPRKAVLAASPPNPVVPNAQTKPAWKEGSPYVKPKVTSTLTRSSDGGPAAATAQTVPQWVAPPSLARITPGPKPLQDSEADIENMGADELLENCLAEFVAEETAPEPPREVDSVQVAQQFASKLSALDVSGMGEVEIVQAQIQTLQAELDARVMREVTTWLNGAITKVVATLAQEDRDRKAQEQAAESQRLAKERQEEEERRRAHVPLSAAAPTAGAPAEAEAAPGVESTEPLGPVDAPPTETLTADPPAATPAGETKAEPAAGGEDAAVPKPGLPALGLGLNLQKLSAPKVEDDAQSNASARSDGGSDGGATSARDPDGMMSARSDAMMSARSDALMSARSARSDYSAHSSRSGASGRSGYSERSGMSGLGSEATSARSLMTDLTRHQSQRFLDDDLEEEEYLGYMARAYGSPKRVGKEKVRVLNGVPVKLTKEQEEKMLRRPPLLDEPDVQKQKHKLKGLLQYLPSSSMQHQMVLKELQVIGLRERAAKKAERSKLLPALPQVESSALSDGAAVGQPMDQSTAAAGCLLSLASALAYSPAGLAAPKPKSPKALDELNSMLLLDSTTDNSREDGSYKGLDLSRQKRSSASGLQVIDEDPAYSTPAAGPSVPKKTGPNTMAVL
uniref:Uncharacterized protein n=1 Tax=Eutreptiella gymnastica TaxID=73025 RepID=A0A7S1JBG5_9EUGL|mmetsp:Transcript_8208/g.14661  ORF Transcript_8208/g.14661 Transcript_8208/m.14661 type:complete len:1183 (+) Transcript_8208:105-3653(+)